MRRDLGAHWGLILLVLAVYFGFAALGGSLLAAGMAVWMAWLAGRASR